MLHVLQQLQLQTRHRRVAAHVAHADRPTLQSEALLSPHLPYAEGLRVDHRGLHNLLGRENAPGDGIHV